MKDYFMFQIWIKILTFRVQMHITVQCFWVWERPNCRNYSVMYHETLTDLQTFITFSLSIVLIFWKEDKLVYSHYSEISLQPLRGKHKTKNSNEYWNCDTQWNIKKRNMHIIFKYPSATMTLSLFIIINIMKLSCLIHSSHLTFILTFQSF
jgi:hypothetical protein